MPKTVIREKYYLDQCFNEIIFRLENWISHRNRWNVDNILSQYLNISSYKPLSGKYRGAAHWKCNMNLKTSKKFFVIFHNLRGYDSHLILKN